MTSTDIDPLIRGRLASFLEDQQNIVAMASGQDGEAINSALSSAHAMAATIRSEATGQCRNIIHQIIRRIDLIMDHVAIQLNEAGLRAKLQIDDAANEDETADQVLLSPVIKVRRGHALRLVLPPSTPDVPPQRRDENLVQFVAEAHAARKLVLQHPEQSIAAIAADQGRCRTRLGKLVGLSCLAPDIVTAIVEGRQPTTLTAKSLSAIALPMHWQGQRKALGF
ncbi:hypothetical protein [Sphingopyxis sp.]|uniref:hypothetical protein n=1 Tax=Sphingopyxis sp. TaxID=1908224 RepID=UPI003D108985